MYCEKNFPLPNCYLRLGHLFPSSEAVSNNNKNLVSCYSIEFMKLKTSVTLSCRVWYPVWTLGRGHQKFCKRFKQCRFGKSRALTCEEEPWAWAGVVRVYSGGCGRHDRGGQHVVVTARGADRHERVGASGPGVGSPTRHHSLLRLSTQRI